MRHINIPIFIPHLGCPNDCVFYNQRYISGVDEFCADGIRDIIDTALSTTQPCDEVEIAFFGGSFTGIDRNLMINLLEIARSYVLSGRVRSLRCSTRPDYIDAEILDILKEYGMTVIELGLQSANDAVLAASRRGHTAERARQACKMIVDAGFTLVGQMMIGLPLSDLECELETARFIAESGARYARIYPTVVFRDTELCAMCARGEYDSLTLGEAVERSSRVLDLLLTSGVEVIRIGLCDSENLRADETYYAGPNHSALGELVINELYRMRIKKQLDALCDLTGADVRVSVGRGCISKAVGQHRKNKNELIKEYNLHSITFVEDGQLSGYDIKTERMHRCI